MEELIAIARIARPRGLRGELSADLLTDFPERFEGLKAVTSKCPNGARKPLVIENFWFQKSRVVLKFAGLDTVESVEHLRGCEICVAATDAVSLDEDEYFDWQLEDCTVETVSGEKLGKVDRILRTGGTELLVVKGETKEILIPFARSICTEIDLDQKVVIVDPPDGLLDF